MKTKYFIFLIHGYFENLKSFTVFENYHLHALKVAQDMGYRPVIIVRGGYENILTDENLDKDILVYNYKNFYYFIFLLFKYSFFRKNTFYINSHEKISYLALMFVKIFSFGLSKNIFMAHTQPKRGGLGNAKLKQCFQDEFLFKFFVDKIRLNNITEKNYLISRGIKESKLFVSPLIVDNNIFKKISDIKNRKNLLIFGQISKVKDISTILKAFKIIIKKFPETRLGVVGAEKDFILKEDSDYLEIKQNIDIFGFMEQNRHLNDFMNKYLIYVNSSKMEGQCLAAFESALAGCALCLPNIMSFKDVFKDKALFHEVGDHRQLAKNIEYYLSNPQIAKKDNENALDMIEKKYNKDIIEKKMQKLFTF